MTRRNTPLEVEQVEQLALIARLLPHHGESPSLISQSGRNHCSPVFTSPFSTASVKLRSSGYDPLCPVGSQNRNSLTLALRDGENVASSVPTGLAEGLSWR